VCPESLLVHGQVNLFGPCPESLLVRGQVRLFGPCPESILIQVKLFGIANLIVPGNASTTLLSDSIVSVSFLAHAWGLINACICTFVLSGSTQHQINPGHTSALRLLLRFEVL